MKEREPQREGSLEAWGASAARKEGRVRIQWEGEIRPVGALPAW